MQGHASRIFDHKKMQLNLKKFFSSYINVNNLLSLIVKNNKINFVFIYYISLTYFEIILNLMQFF